MPNSLLTVEILGFPGVQLLDVAGPLQVFASANVFLAAKSLPARYALSLVADRSPVMTSAGLELTARPLSRASNDVDTLIVPGGEGVDAALADPALLDWVRCRAGTARRTVAVCTGAFLLAEAGLLDGKCAVTHWARCEELGRRFPAVTVQPKPIFVRDGSVWSSAGVTAGLDLCLALVEDDSGRDVANEVAKDLVMFLKRPGDQAQFSQTLSLQRAGVFEHLHSWILNNLGADLSVEALARQCGMTERTFSRRYCAEQGCSPARMVEQMRVEAAKRMLAATSDPLKVIAARCGFTSDHILRRSFYRQYSISPLQYRQNWGRMNS
jgi:transcriptional regulator GlxA family with amidase domain